MTQSPLVLVIESSSRIGSVALAIGPELLAENVLSGPMKHSAELFPAICELLKKFKRKPDDIQQVYISIGPGSFTGLRIATTIAKTLHLANRTKIVPVNTLDVIAANVIDLIPTSDEHRATSIEYRVSSIQHPASSIETIAPILDAKRGQFYTAIYQKQITAENVENTEKELNYKLNSARSASSAVKEWEKLLPDALMTADEFLNRFADKENPVWLLGDGLLYHKEEFKTDGTCFFDEKFWSPRASKVHQLGWQLALQNRFADSLSLTPNYLLRPEIKIKSR